MPGPGVSQPLRNRDSRTQTQQLGRDRAKDTNRSAEIENPFGDFVEDVTAADGLVEVLRPTAFITVVVHPDSRRVDVGRPLAGEFVGHPVRSVDEVSSLAVGLRLMLAQPCRFKGVPLGSGRRSAGTVVEASNRVGSLSAGRLFSGADIHPHDGWTQLVAALVHGNHGERRSVIRDTGDSCRGNSSGRNGAVAGCLQCLPPLFGILLGPAGMRMGGLVRGCREGKRTPLKVEDRDSARLGAIIDAQEVGAIVQHRCLL